MIPTKTAGRSAISHQSFCRCCRILLIGAVLFLVLVWGFGALSGKPAQASSVPGHASIGAREQAMLLQTGLAFTKTGVLVLNVVPPADVANAGDVVSYTLVATNTGIVTLTGVTIADPQLGALSCTLPVTLAPDAALVCNGAHVLTHGDISAEQVLNVATISTNETAPVEASAVVTVPTAPGLALLNTGPRGPLTIGDLVTFTVFLTNTGNVGLADITLADVTLGITRTLSALQPAESAIVTMTYGPIGERDLPGPITSTAGVTATIVRASGGALGPVTATHAVPLTIFPGLALTKTAATGAAEIGSTVRYTFTVRNTGNVTLTDVTLDDPRLNWTQGLGAVTVGETRVVTANYGPLSEADLPSPLVNSAVVTGITPLGDTVASVTSTHTLYVTIRPDVILSSTVNPSSFGQPVTFTATVTPGYAGAGTPTGVVTFTVDSTTITRTLSGGVATYTPASLGVGSHAVTAGYGGNLHFLPSYSGPITQTVARAGTSALIVASPNASVYGQRVTFTTTVSVTAPGAGMPTGIVTFTVDGAAFTQTLAGGVATYTTSSLVVGSHPVTATYGGSGDFLPSTPAVLTQVVNKAGSAAVLTSLPNPSQLGQLVTISATIAAQAPGAGTPTGMVTFTVGGAIVTASLSSGVAAFSTTGLVVGSHPISATYEGDGSFDASVSAVMTQTVIRAATAVTLINAPTTTVYGQPVIFTATVTSTQKSIGMPTGTVTFTAGASVVGAAALDANGVATFTTQVLAVGVQPILATYGGDARFSVSASDAVTQTVQKAATATTLVSSPAATIYGEAISFTATVSIMPPGAGTLTGTVVFLNDATTVGTGEVGAGGVATLTTTALPAGSPAVTAVFAGNVSFATSASAPVTQTVSKADTTMVLVTAPNPSPAQTSVAFTATLSVTPPGGGTPTGVVTYTAGSSVFTASLQGGVATGYLATLSVGTHAVSAVYAGDANFLGSNATAADQVVTCLPLAVVTSAADNGLGTLRRAVADTCTDGRIEFNLAAPTRIDLTSGQLELLRNVTISGPGPAAVAVSGRGLSRVFSISSGVAATISGLMIRDGRVNAPDNGGGIHNSGTLTLTTCALVDNLSGNIGGGIYNHTAVLNVSNCTFSGNGAGSWGGGLATFYGTLVVTGSTFSANGAGYWGGALFANYGAHTLANSTLSGNSAGYSGGGIAVLNGAVTATNLTLVGNGANLGGGVSNSGGALTLRNSILAGSISGGNCAGAITNGGSNLDSSATCGFGAANGSQSNIDPMLGALADNGGGTWTYALLPGSPAIDAGDGTVCAAAPVTGVDQRGVLRPQGAVCDIGAFESRGFDLVISSGSPQTTSIGAAFAAPLEVTVIGQEGEPTGPGGLVRFTPPADGAGLDIGVPFTLTTDSRGVVSSTATTNRIAGSYVVTASARGEFAPARFELTNIIDNVSVHKIGTGTGMVTSLPPGLECGITCTASFGVGSVIILTADPESGSAFGGWEGCDAVPAALDTAVAAPACRVTVLTSSHVTATFTLGQLQIDVRAEPAEGGFVSGGGLYNYGFPVIVTASAYPGYAFVNWTENDLPVSTETHYSFSAAASRQLVANFTTAKPGVIAFGDAASVMTGESVNVSVLANDVDQTNSGLTVLSVGQPLHGLAVINAPGQTIRYLSPSNYSGIDRFTYIVQDGDGYTDTATVAIDVTSPRISNAPAQVVILNPAIQRTEYFTGSNVLVAVDVPAGVYTGALQTGDALFLSFTPIMTPTENTTRPPGALKFGNVEFALTAFLNGQPLAPEQFAAPVTVTIDYDAQSLANFNLLTLQLFYWAGTEWRTDGITLVSHDVVRSIFTVVLDHLSEFAFFGELLPPTNMSLYLPAVMRNLESAPVLESGHIDNISPESGVP